MKDEENLFSAFYNTKAPLTRAEKLLLITQLTALEKRLTDAFLEATAAYQKILVGMTAGAVVLDDVKKHLAELRRELMSEETKWN
jgi:hypothetical protein